MPLMHEPVKHTTIITSPEPGKMSPIEAAMMDACNALHEAVSRRDGDTAARVRHELAELLDRYEAAGAENHPTPKWAVPHYRALSLSAGEDLEQAVVYEELALEHAASPRQQEISLGNLAERSMRLGRLDEAIEFFFRARDVAPRSVPILVTGAQALYAAGFRTEADSVFAALLGMDNQFKAGTELDALLEYETRLSVMRVDLPSLDNVFRKWEVARGGRG